MIQNNIKIDGKWFFPMQKPNLRYEQIIPGNIWLIEHFCGVADVTKTMGMNSSHNSSLIYQSESDEQ